jgi:hypothetical protein
MVVAPARRRKRRERETDGEAAGREASREGVVERCGGGCCGRRRRGRARPEVGRPRMDLDARAIDGDVDAV